MTENDTIYVFSLSSGAMVIGTVIANTADDYILQSPMELTVGYDQEGIMKFYMQQYFPYAKNNQIILLKNGVEAMSIASGIYATIYVDKIREFEKIKESYLKLLEAPENSIEPASDAAESNSTVIRQNHPGNSKVH